MHDNADVKPAAWLVQNPSSLDSLVWRQTGTITTLPPMQNVSTSERVVTFPVTDPTHDNADYVKLCLS